ncbi:MAG: hypothetical protein COA52_15220 [Hyphomicrobiales bacterium]|nr:MAG: hypothetical protein COA52_15220 [Hyphomicrobiales bacterium]
MAILALVFGVLTLFSGGSVLFGPQEARDAAGAYIPLMVWFNFTAGFFYVIAAIGIWLGRSWACILSVFIAAATGIAALAFGFHTMQGAAFEMRTVGALVLRFGFWVMIAMTLRGSIRKAKAKL